MNLHPRDLHHDTVECSGRKLRGNVQGCVCHWVCFGIRGGDLCKSHDVEIVQDSGGVCNMRGKKKGGVGRNMEYTYSSFCNALVQLVRHDNVDLYPTCCWLMNTKWPSLYHVQLPDTSQKRCREMRLSLRSEESLRCQLLLLQHAQLMLLRPCASQSKLSHSRVVPTVLPSNIAINMSCTGKSTRN